MFRTFGLGISVALLSASAALADPTCASGTWANLTNGTAADAGPVMTNFNCLAVSPTFSGTVRVGGTSGTKLSLGPSQSGDRPFYFYENGNYFRGFGNDLGSIGGYETNIFGTDSGSGAGGISLGKVALASPHAYTPLMVVRNDAKVGIGTSSPAGNLDIYSSVIQNGLSIAGAANGTAPSISSVGTSDANVGMTIQSKGTGSIDFKTGGNTQLRVANFASAADYLQIAGGNASNAVTVQTGGTDSAISLWLSSKGGGTIFLATSGLKVASFITSSTPANYPSFQANNAGGPAQILANGSDTNVDLRLSTRGTGSLDLWTSSRQARVMDTASAVDYLTFTGGASSSNNVTIGATGSDTNVSITLTPKGSGTVVLNAQAKVASLASASGTHLCIDGSNIIASCSSSLRYKENIRSATFGLKDVLAMRPVTFKWKGRDEKDIGFIAEEMAKINPLFATYKDGRIEGVKYPQLTAVLTRAIQEQQKAIGLLQAANDDSSLEIRSLRKLNKDQAREIDALRTKQSSETQELRSAIAELKQAVRVRTAQR